MQISDFKVDIQWIIDGKIACSCGVVDGTESNSTGFESEMDMLSNVLARAINGLLSGHGPSPDDVIKGLFQHIYDDELRGAVIEAMKNLDKGK